LMLGEQLTLLPQTLACMLISPEPKSETILKLMKSCLE
jgi:hypothetical protein